MKTFFIVDPDGKITGTLQSNDPTLNYKTDNKLVDVWQIKEGKEILKNMAGYLIKKGKVLKVKHGA